MSKKTLKKVKKNVISPGILVLITVALITSLRGFPVLAQNGLSSIFFYMFAAIFFMLPVAFISAELASTWPEKGGIFLWITKAFGNKWGFFASFFQWIPVVIWYPTVLSFIAASFSYIFDASLIENKYYILSMILIIYWGATFLNFKGLKFSGKITSYALFIGTFIPAAVIIFTSIFWMFKGYPSQISFGIKHLLPNFSNMQSLVLLAGTVLFFSGIEISAVHINEVENPRKNYPKAILLAALIIISIYILGTLAIAIVVPPKEISFVAGVLQAITYFFEIFNLGFLVPILAVLISFGAMGQVLTLIIGPSKAIHAAALKGYLPSFCKKVNKRNIPTNILYIQAIIVTLISIVFLFMPTVSSSFWMLSVLVIQLYIIMYIIFYIAAIKLRYKYPKLKRPFYLGKNWVLWTVSSIGILVILGVFFLSFIPPINVPKESTKFFVWFLICGIIVMTAIPHFLYKISKNNK